MLLDFRRFHKEIERYIKQHNARNKTESGGIYEPTQSRMTAPFIYTQNKIQNRN